MAIFLSAGHLDNTVAALTQHYPLSTPVAIVQRASWPEQKIVRGTLETIASLAEGIDRTAVILVGEVLANEGEASKLYDRTFSHDYREGQAE